MELGLGLDEEGHYAGDWGMSDVGGRLYGRFVLHCRALVRKLLLLLRRRSACCCRSWMPLLVGVNAVTCVMRMRENPRTLEIIIIFLPTLCPRALSLLYSVYSWKTK